MKELQEMLNKILTIVYESWVYALRDNVQSADVELVQFLCVG